MQYLQWAWMALRSTDHFGESETMEKVEVLVLFSTSTNNGCN